MTIFFFKQTHQKYSHLNADCCHPTRLTGLLAPSEMLALSHSCQGIGLALIVLLSVCHLHSINEDFLWAKCSAGLWRQKDEERFILGGPDHSMPPTPPPRWFTQHLSDTSCESSTLLSPGRQNCYQCGSGRHLLEYPGGWVPRGSSFLSGLCWDTLNKTNFDERRTYLAYTFRFIFEGHQGRSSKPEPWRMLSVNWFTHVGLCSVSFLIQPSLRNGAAHSGLGTPTSINN